MVWETPPRPSLLSKAEWAELKVSKPLHAGALETMSGSLCYPAFACCGSALHPSSHTGELMPVSPGEERG